MCLRKFYSPGPQPGLKQPPMKFKCVSFSTNIPTWHCALWKTLFSKHGPMQACGNLQRWLDLWTDRFWKTTHTAPEGRGPLRCLSDHTHKTRHASGRHACLPVYAWLWQACWKDSYLFTKISIIRAADGNFSLLQCCLVQRKGKSNCVCGGGGEGVKSRLVFT